MNTRTIMLTLALALSTGCAPQRLVKDGITQSQADRDNWECQLQGNQMAAQLYGPDGAIFFGPEYKIECLKARGYRRQ